MVIIHDQGLEACVRTLQHMTPFSEAVQEIGHRLKGMGAASSRYTLPNFWPSPESPLFTE